MSNTGWAVVIIAIIIILGGGWWWFSAQAPAMPATSDTTAVVNSTNNTGTDSAGAGADAGATPRAAAGQNPANTTTIHYTAAGFSPKTVTVPVGGAVNFINDTTGAMWVASDDHPTHTEFDGSDRATHCSGSYAGATPFDQCQNGSSYTFVFSKTGSFSFHNHSASQFGGTVTVQ